MSKSKDNKREIAAVFLGVSVAVILWITVFRRETIVADSLVLQPFHSIWSFWSNIRKQGIRGNVLGKRDLLNRLDIEPLFVSCFDEIYIRVLMEAQNPVTIKQPLYNYRVGSGTMSSSYTDVEHYRNFVEAPKKLRKVMQSKDAYWKDYFDFRVAYYLLATMAVAANAGDKDAYGRNRDDNGNRDGDAEEAVENSYRNEYTWREDQIGEDPETIYIRKETRREMLDSMTEKQREVFILYYYYGYKQQEIAEMLGAAISTVNQHLRYAVENARKKYF